jgi:hypothetical protein
LENVSFDSGAERLGDVLIFVMTSQQNGPGLRGRPAYFSRGLQPIHQWHADIHHSYIWAYTGGHTYQFLAV